MGIKILLEKILSGTREEARAALKDLEKVWRAYAREGIGSKKDWTFFINALKKFDDALSLDNKTVFVAALRYPIMAIGEKHFEEFSDFVLKVVSDPAGRLRQAAVSIAVDLVWSLEMAQMIVGAKPIPQKLEERIKANRVRFGVFIDKLEKLRDMHCEIRLESIEYIEELPPSICKSAEAMLFDILDDDTAEYIYEAHKDGRLTSLDMVSPAAIYEMGRARDKEDLRVPEWMECTWRRVPCGKKSCPVCGRIASDRERYPKERENAKSMEASLTEMMRGLSKTLKMLKKNAKMHGIDLETLNQIKSEEPPRQVEFPLCRLVMDWNKNLFQIEAMAQDLGAFWLQTEAAADLFWYANVLNGKVYRQLCNRWHLERGDDYGDFDFEYTGNILGESLKILKKSLNELSLWSPDQKGELLLAASHLAQLEEKIQAI